ncbi:MAG: hypothetical protein U9R25_02905 [Chloroflexota bacterium]|nr:hypothetical protein [Chloroflexota bacterium]
MSTSKRILLYAAIVLSVIALLISVAGIIAVWYYNTPVTESILSLLVPATDAMARVEQRTGETGMTLTDVSAGLQTAGQQVQDLGEEVLATDIALELISRKVGEDIRPKIQETAVNVESVYDTVVAFEEAIVTFNEMPFVDLELPGAAEIGQIRGGMEDVAGQIGDLSERLQTQKEDIVTDAVNKIAQPLAQIDTRVTEINTQVDDIHVRAGASREQLLWMQGEVPGWIDMFSVATTLFLGWVIISQVIVILCCRKTLQGKVA